MMLNFRPKNIVTDIYTKSFSVPVDKITALTAPLNTEFSKSIDQPPKGASLNALTSKAGLQQLSLRSTNQV